ncbi:hypothetical protein O3P69_006707 [Scylla paramamosain]|uniref:Uncharacterized protein n=1 Tax=Scylla paramamosain TaxID=85552 RepID=A0AAW0U419_SCYPA
MCSWCITSSTVTSGKQDRRAACLVHVSPKPKLVVPQFLQAIKPALEEEWTPEVEEAWCLLMRNIAFALKCAMLEAMKK